MFIRHSTSFKAAINGCKCVIIGKCLGCYSKNNHAQGVTNNSPLSPTPFTGYIPIILQIVP